MSFEEVGGNEYREETEKLALDRKRDICGRKGKKKC